MRYHFRLTGLALCGNHKSEKLREQITLNCIIQGLTRRVQCDYMKQQHVEMEVNNLFPVSLYKAQQITKFYKLWTQASIR
jgi:hypothetical protein